MPMKRFTMLFMCLLVLAGVSTSLAAIGGGNSNIASGTGQTAAAQTAGDVIAVTITSPRNLASITGISVNGKGVTFTPPVIDPTGSTKEVVIQVTLLHDTPAGSDIIVNGTTVASVPGGTTLTVTN